MSAIIRTSCDVCGGIFDHTDRRWQKVSEFCPLSDRINRTQGLYFAEREYDTAVFIQLEMVKDAVSRVHDLFWTIDATATS